MYRKEHGEFSAVEFALQGYDADTGMIRMGARDYDPVLGRFVTPDLVFLEDPELCVEDPVSCNLFSYARNNPLNYVDPSGGFPFLAPLLAVGGSLAFDFFMNPAPLNAPSRDGKVDLSMPPETKMGIALGVAALGKSVWQSLSSSRRSVQGLLEGNSNFGRSSTTALELNKELTAREAAAVFTKKGLHPDVIRGSSPRIRGDELKNQSLIKALTSDGSHINDWAKYTTQTFKSPSGNFQVHFYKNAKTGKEYYGQ